MTPHASGGRLAAGPCTPRRAARHGAIAALALGLSLAACTAAADSITLTFIPGSISYFSHSTGPIASGAGAIPAQLLFDSALGTLEEAEVRYAGSGFVSKTLDVAPGIYTVFASLDLHLVHAASGLDVSLVAPLGFSDFEVTEAGPFAFGEGNSRMLGLAATSGLGVFVTGGVLELTVRGLIDVSGPGGCAYSGLGDTLTGDSSIGQAITYRYAPVPEPGAGLLAGLGLALLGAQRRPAPARGGLGQAHGARR